METLTQSALRRLVSLYRQGVEGAVEQLSDLIEHRSDRLRTLLGDVVFDGGGDEVEQLALRVERSRRRRALERARSDRDLAGKLAKDLAVFAEWVGPDQLRLDPAKLAELVACRSYDWLVFDSMTLRGVERRRVQAFFRECKRVQIIEAEVDAGVVHFHYRTLGGRGEIRFWLQPTPIKATRLVIEWPRHTPVTHARAAETVPEFVSEPEAYESRDDDTEFASEGDEGPDDDDIPFEPVTPPRSIPPPTRGRVPVFLRHLLDAASEAVG